MIIAGCTHSFEQKLENKSFLWRTVFITPSESGSVKLERCCRAQAATENLARGMFWVKCRGGLLKYFVFQHQHRVYVSILKRPQSHEGEEIGAMRPDTRDTGEMGQTIDNERMFTSHHLNFPPPTESSVLSERQGGVTWWRCTQDTPL